MSDEPAYVNGGVRISPEQIYNKLVDVEAAQRETTQTMREIVLPTLNIHTKQINGLNFRYYAIIAGFISSLAVVLKLAGVF